MEQEQKSADLLGLAPYGEAIKIVTEKGCETAQEFLYAICRPAAEEFGLLLRDKVRLFRARNLATIANKARELVSIGPEGSELRAPPRLIADVVESGSWCDDEQLQTMWAGLLASACTPDGNDETNLMFSDILKKLSAGEAKLIEYGCNNSEKKMSERGFLVALPYGVTVEKIIEITGWRDAATVQFQLEHLFTLGLLRGGGGVRQDVVINYQKPNQKSIPQVTPEQLGLQFYVRCCGSRKSPAEFFRALDH